jgi:WD40 repeat protein
MGTICSNKRTAEAAEAAASLDDDAPRECDTTPAIPISLISHLILPFLQDRPTWNAVCSANKELHEAGMRMTPPWPATKLELGQKVGVLKFSPCGSFLASGTSWSRAPFLVHICDRRGRQTCLTGHTTPVLCLSFSNDGNYLASAGCSTNDASIRIWPSDPTTRLPQQSDRTLRGHRGVITCLDFSPHDTNLLASGDAGAIKLWNVQQEVCIYSFDHNYGHIPTLCFPVQDEGKKCIFITGRGALIRTSWWNDLSDIESDIVVDIPRLGHEVWTSAFSNCGSLLAAVSPGSYDTVTLYDTRAMTVVQSLSIDRNTIAVPSNSIRLAFSPDDKSLVLRFKANEIHIYEVPDLNIRRILRPGVSRHTGAIKAVAFDPSGQFLASAEGGQNVRLWTL